MRRAQKLVQKAHEVGGVVRRRAVEEAGKGADRGGGQGTGEKGARRVDGEMEMMSAMAKLEWETMKLLGEEMKQVRRREGGGVRLMQRGGRDTGVRSCSMPAQQLLEIQAVIRSINQSIIQSILPSIIRDRRIMRITNRMKVMNSIKDT